MSVNRTESKIISSLRTRKGRKAHRQFAAEGVRLLEEALRHKNMPTTLYCTPARLNRRGNELVDAYRVAGVPIRELTTRQLESIADTKTPQGLLGIFKIPQTYPAQLFRQRHRKVILCEGVSDPGNVGTLMRSALAFGFDAMLLVGASADPFSPKVVRSSAGAVFGLKVIRLTIPEALGFIEEGRFMLVATSRAGRSDAKELKTAAKSGRLVVAVGSEAEGLSNEIVRRCDLLWRISHAGVVESLNVAVAGSIIMKQVYDA